MKTDVVRMLNRLEAGLVSGMQGLMSSALIGMGVFCLRQSFMSYDHVGFAVTGLFAVCAGILFLAFTVCTFLNDRKRDLARAAA